MARSSRMTTARRGLTTPTSSLLPRLLILPPIVPSLAPYEDRRLHDPTRTIRPPAALRRSAVRIAVKSEDRFGKSVRAFPFRQRFKVPAEVIICVRRRIRKEVLHAINKAGKGGRQMKRPRRNFWSDVSC